MHERWRYEAPCGHVNVRVFNTNDPERRYQCMSCEDSPYYGVDEVVDKKKQ